MPVLFFSNNLSCGQTWENLNEVYSWDESRMTSFGSSLSVQQEEVGKVLINRNEQKRLPQLADIWKLWSTFFCFRLTAMRSSRSQILYQTNGVMPRLLLLYTKSRRESVSERRVRQAVTLGKDVSDISICQSWNQAPGTAQGPETLTHPPCMCSDSSDFALHVWKCFTLTHFSICREAVP